jgi:hypothetical protein
MRQKRVDEGSRLSRLAERHALNPSSDLAQIFRVTRSTIGRWREQARSRPLREVMPGPAMILLELFEDGLETSDLREVRAAAQIRNGPADLVLQADEDQWEIKPSEGKRKPVRIALSNGREIEVFPRWLKARIRYLQSLEKHMEATEKLRCARVIERYRQALSGAAPE